ncbi:MAG TPA: hypothetical protein VK475_13665 [Pyrinomonadaceae bacterium]|nr:hypothetical protein [Pyrinomonadaceae bacterium]
MRFLLIGFLLGTALCANAFGQGRIATPERPTINSSTSTAQSMGDGDSGVYSQSVTGQVVSLDPTDNSLVVNLKGKQVTVLIQKDTRMRADKNTDLADKAGISLADYKPGQMVKIIYRVSDNKTLEVRLKRPKS